MEPTGIQSSTLYVPKDTMIQVQSPMVPTTYNVDCCTFSSFTSRGVATPMDCIPVNWTFGNLLADSYLPQSAEKYLQACGRSSDDNDPKEYIVQLLKRFRQMGGPMDIPLRKPINEVLADYICALSRKKNTILELAKAEVDCEECEAMLCEAYGATCLQHIRNVHFVTDDPKSATGRYFDAVSGVRFDPPKMV